MLIRGTQAASVSAEGDRLRGRRGRRWKDTVVERKMEEKGEHNESHLGLVRRTKREGGWAQ